LYKNPSLSSNHSVLPLPASPNFEREDNVSKATAGGTLEKFDPLDTHVPDFSCTGRYTHRLKDNSNYVGLEQRNLTRISLGQGKVAISKTTPGQETYCRHALQLLALSAWSS
jgi:hypothetical protein